MPNSFKITPQKPNEQQNYASSPLVLSNITINPLNLLKFLVISSGLFIKPTIAKNSEIKTRISPAIAAANSFNDLTSPFNSTALNLYEQSPTKYPELSFQQFIKSTRQKPQSQFTRKDKKIDDNIIAFNQKIAAIRAELMQENHDTLPTLKQVIAKLKTSNPAMFNDKGGLQINSDQTSSNHEFCGLDLSQLIIDQNDFFEYFTQQNAIILHDVNLSKSIIMNQQHEKFIDNYIEIRSGNLSNACFRNLHNLILGNFFFRTFDLAMQKNAMHDKSSIDDDGNIKTLIVKNYQNYQEKLEQLNQDEIILTDTKFEGVFLRPIFYKADFSRSDFTQATLLNYQLGSIVKNVQFMQEALGANLDQTKFGVFALPLPIQIPSSITSQNINFEGAKSLGLTAQQIDIAGSNYIAKKTAKELASNQKIFIRLKANHSDESASALSSILPNFKIIFNISQYLQKQILNSAKRVIDEEFCKYDICSLQEDEEVPANSQVKNLNIYVHEGKISASASANLLDENMNIAISLRRNISHTFTHEIGHALAGFEHPAFLTMAVSAMSYQSQFNKLGYNQTLLQSPYISNFGKLDKETLREIMTKNNRKIKAFKDDVISYEEIKQIQEPSTRYLGGDNFNRMLKINFKDLDTNDTIAIMRASDLMLSCYKTSPDDCFGDELLAKDSALAIFQAGTNVSQTIVKHILIFDGNNNKVQITDKDLKVSEFTINSDNFTPQQQQIIFDQGKVIQGNEEEQDNYKNIIIIIPSCLGGLLTLLFSKMIFDKCQAANQRSPRQNSAPNIQPSTMPSPAIADRPIEISSSPRVHHIV